MRRLSRAEGQRSWVDCTSQKKQNETERLTLISQVPFLSVKSKHRGENTSREDSKQLSEGRETKVSIERRHEWQLVRNRRRGISCRGQELINQIIKTDSRGGGRRITVKGRSEKGKRQFIEAPHMIPPPPPTDPPTTERRQRPDGEGEGDELNSPAAASESILITV